MYDFSYGTSQFSYRLSTFVLHVLNIPRVGMNVRTSRSMTSEADLSVRLVVTGGLSVEIPSTPSTPQDASTQLNTSNATQLPVLTLALTGVQKV